MYAFRSMLVPELSLTFLYALLQGSDGLLCVPLDEVSYIPLRHVLYLNLVVYTDSLLRDFLDQLVSVEKKGLQVTDVFIRRLIEYSLVHVSHGVFGYHQGVGLVVLPFSDAYASFNL